MKPVGSVFIKNNIIILYSIPVLIIAFIYIQYGETIGQFIEQNSYLMDNIFKIDFHLDFFNSNVQLPQIVKAVGLLSVRFVNLIFVLHLFINIPIYYYSLSRKIASKISMLLEIGLLLIGYLVIFRQGMEVWIEVMVYLSFLIHLALLSLYSIYEKKISHEKK